MTRLLASALLPWLLAVAAVIGLVHHYYPRSPR